MYTDVRMSFEERSTGALSLVRDWDQSGLERRLLAAIYLIAAMTTSVSAIAPAA